MRKEEEVQNKAVERGEEEIGKERQERKKRKRK
jgi:hypothetical protein